MKLIAVTNDSMPIDKLVQTLVSIELYIDLVILREKSKTDSELGELIRKLDLARFDQTKIIVHGRADLASLTNSQKVHLPGYGLPFPLLKSQFPTLSFGRSVHSYEETIKATDDGAHWVLYGHLYETGSKTGLPPRGTDELGRIAASLSIPVYAIGGIKPKHLGSLRKLGVSGVAVMSSIFESVSPVDAAKNYYDALHFEGGNFS